jgi:Tol biopolymer transport system component
VTGEMLQVSKEATVDTTVRISDDGKTLLYFSRISGSNKLFVRDLAGGAPRQLLPAWQFGQWISLVGGTKAIFLCISKNERGIYVLDINRGVPLLLTRSPNFWTASENGRYLITYPTGVHLLDGISVFDTESGKETMLASRPKTELLSPCFSPDNRWVAMHLRNSELSRQMFVLPFHPGRATPESEWIPVGDGKQLDRDPKWSPDGNLLYFLADRDGARGIYAQRIDAVTRHPLGKPFEVKMFRSTRRSMMYFANSGVSAPAIVRDRMVFALGEMTGNIWLTKAPL